MFSVALAAYSVKTAALESLLPKALEEHVLLNQARLGTYELLRRELSVYVEARTGARIKDTPVLTQKQRHKEVPQATTDMH